MVFSADAAVEAAVAAAAAVVVAVGAAAEPAAAPVAQYQSGMNTAQTAVENPGIADSPTAPDHPVVSPVSDPVRRAETNAAPYSNTKRRARSIQPVIRSQQIQNTLRSCDPHNHKKRIVRSCMQQIMLLACTY